MRVETVEVVRYEPGDIVDISEIRGLNPRPHKSLNENNRAMIIRVGTSSYDVLTEDWHCVHIPPGQLKKVRYIKHVNIWEAAGESQTD